MKYNTEKCNLDQEKKYNKCYHIWGSNFWIFRHQYIFYIHIKEKKLNKIGTIPGDGEEATEENGTVMWNNLNYENNGGFY